MGDRIPVALSPILIQVNSEAFQTIREWPFADAYVARLLKRDIPQRVQFGKCRIWAYRDPAKKIVGIGTFDVCSDCSQYTKTSAHPYIPLLAVNPTMPSLGYGTSIVRHLIGEAAILAIQSGGALDVLFLDVYASNLKAISLYEKCGFVKMMDEPIADPLEDNKLYFIMAQRVSGPLPVF
jgi:ribosomal protein S18 acetylase RimI-like enzyme